MEASSDASEEVVHVSVKPTKVKKKERKEKSGKSRRTESGELQEDETLSAASSNATSTSVNDLSSNGENWRSGSERSGSMPQPELKKSEVEVFVFENRGGTESSAGSLVSSSSASRLQGAGQGDMVMESSGTDGSWVTEQVRNNLMSPLNRVRHTTGRMRSGSSPSRRAPAAVLRAQVVAETEQLAKAGNAQAKRILHRSKSESVVTLNSWDLGVTAGLRSTFAKNDQLLARATAAATTRRQKFSSNQPRILSSRRSALHLPDNFTPAISKDSVAQKLMLSPMTPQKSSEGRSSTAKSSSKRESNSGPSLTSPSSGRRHVSSSNLPKTTQSPAKPGSPGPSDLPLSARAATSMSIPLSAYSLSGHTFSDTNDTLPSPSSIIDDDSSQTSSGSPSTTPRSPAGKRSLASFGRKTSYHSLGRTSSGFLPSLLDTLGSPSANTDTSSGDKRKSRMHAFLRFVSSHLSDPTLAEGIALMHGVLAPSTFLFDHLQQLFKGEAHDAETYGDINTLRRDIINFIGIWITFSPNDFLDDFVLEKKVTDWITSNRGTTDSTLKQSFLLLQTIVNQSSAYAKQSAGRTLSDAEILDMAESARKGLDPGDLVSVTPPPPPRVFLSPEMSAFKSSRPKSISLEEATQRESLRSARLAKSPSLGSVDETSESAADSSSILGSESSDSLAYTPITSTHDCPSPLVSTEPSFEGMLDLAKRSSSARFEAIEKVVSASSSLSTPSSPKASRTSSKSAGESSKKDKEKDKEKEKEKDKDKKRLSDADAPPTSLSAAPNSPSAGSGSAPTAGFHIPGISSVASSLGSAGSGSGAAASPSSSGGMSPSFQSSSMSFGQVVAPDTDELSKKPKFSKKLIYHLAEQIELRESPLLLNIGVWELAKQWTLLDHGLLCKVQTLF